MKKTVKFILTIILLIILITFLIYYSNRTNMIEGAVFQIQTKILKNASCLGICSECNDDSNKPIGFKLDSYSCSPPNNSCKCKYKSIYGSKV